MSLSLTSSAVHEPNLIANNLTVHELISKIEKIAYQLQVVRPSQYVPINRTLSYNLSEQVSQKPIVSSASYGSLTTYEPAPSPHSTLGQRFDFQFCVPLLENIPATLSSGREKLIRKVEQDLTREFQEWEIQGKQYEQSLDVEYSFLRSLNNGFEVGDQKMEDEEQELRASLPSSFKLSVGKRLPIFLDNKKYIQ